MWEAEEHYKAGYGENKNLCGDPHDYALAQELYDKGLIFLANQNVLHHYGYALGVTVEDDKVVGLDLYKTDDPDGIWFDEENVISGRRKLRENNE